MKKLLLLLLFAPAITFLKAQSKTETATKDEVIKEWAFIGESKTQLDVSYRVVKCSGSGQVHLQIFNENPNNQVGKFQISIQNGDSEKFTKDITFSVDRAAIVQPDCNSEGALTDLKIAVPANYDLNNLRVKIVFK
jgi:hypothetical protein